MESIPSYWALAGALPALIAMWYVDRLDAKRPEPRGTLRKVALAGAVSVIPVVIIELGLLQLSPAGPSYAKAVWDGVIVAALVEEAAKLACVYWLVWHLREFDERLDGIVYATRAGLGFALVENVIYLTQAGTRDEFVQMYIMRAVLAVPGHAIWAGIMGYYLAMRRFEGTGPGLLGGLALAVGLHGLYDVAIFAGEPLRADGYETAARFLLLVPVAVISFGGFALRAMARNALHHDDAAEARAQVRA